MLLLQTAIDSSSEAVLVTDRNGDIVYLNPAVETMTGFSTLEILGKNVNILRSEAHKDEQDRILWETIQAGRSWAGEFLNQRKDGTTYYQRTIISPVLDDQGAISHFVSIASDITKEKKLEEQMIQAAKMDSLGRLASGIAHDFNNYLTIINGYSEVLLFENEQGKDSERLRIILQAGMNASKLVAKILGFSRRQTAAPAILDINATLKDLEKMVRRLLGEGIECRLDPACRRRPRPHRFAAAGTGPDQPGAQRPRRHARRRAPDPGVGPAARRRGAGRRASGAGDQETTRPSAWATAARAWIPRCWPGSSSRSSRPSPRARARGWDWRRCSASSARTAARSGPKASRAAARPSPCSCRKRRAPLAQSAAPGAEPHFDGRTVLLVEDEQDIRELMREILESLGMKVHEATDGNQAVKAAESLKRIDLLFCDVVLPGLMGVEVADRVQKLHPEAAVIFTSGHGESYLKRVGLELKKVHFVEKPSSRAVIVDKIKEALG